MIHKKSRRKTAKNSHAEATDSSQNLAILASLAGISLGSEQKTVFQKLENTNSNYFITGKAGTGKSVLLSYFVTHTKKHIAVVAPTGVSAINVGGFTIHSFFQLEPNFQDCLDYSKVQDLNDKQAHILSRLDTLVIDEISMVSADLLDMIDAKLRFARNSNEPFGGCQVIMFGDPFQLPPIPPRGDALRLMQARYRSPFFFSALVMEDIPLEIIELNHIYRQTDDEFISILNRIRVGDTDWGLINALNKRCFAPSVEQGVAITLASTNQISDRINEHNLAMLPGQIHNYTADVEGDIKRSDYPAPDFLSLRNNAQIMMLKNDHIDQDSSKYNPRWVNGTLATVSRISNDKIYVKIKNKEYEVKRENWDKYHLVGERDHETGMFRLKKETVGTFTQYPMRLAYAITIHKSQGQTYDNVRIDLGRGAFAFGQTYVALSRSRSLDGTSFAHPIRLSDIRVDPRVVNFMRQIY